MARCRGFLLQIFSVSCIENTWNKCMNQKKNKTNLYSAVNGKCLSISFNIETLYVLWKFCSYFLQNLARFMTPHRTQYNHVPSPLTSGLILRFALKLTFTIVGRISFIDNNKKDISIAVSCIETGGQHQFYNRKKKHNRKVVGTFPSVKLNCVQIDKV